MSLVKRIKDNFKKNKWYLLAFTIIWVILVVFLLNKYSTSIGKEFIGNENRNDNVVELNEETKIEALIPSQDKADSVSVLLATYARKNKGEFTIKVTGTTSKYVYAQETINVDKIQDNAYYVLGLNKQLNTIDDSYIRISFTSNSDVGKGIGVYYTSEKCFGNSDLLVSNTKIDGDLSLRYLVENNLVNEFAQKILLWSIVGYSLLILILLLIEPKIEIMFAIIILVFGLIFMITITPMSPPDEETHYHYCIQVSSYMMGQGDTHIFIDDAYVDNGYFGGHYNTAYAYHRLIKKFNKPLELTGDLCEMISDIDYDRNYALYYIPQSIGITIGRLLNLNMLKIFYLGRLFNLLSYTVLMYFAIKKTPILKVLFGIISSLPIFIQQAISYSYDPTIIALCFLELSFILKWIHVDEKISKKEFVLAFINCLILAPAKIVYGFISLLFLFVPSERFESKKKRNISVLILCSPAIIIILYNIISRFVGSLFIVFAEEYVYQEPWNMTYVFKHPIDTIWLFLRTLRYGIKKWFYDAVGYTLSGQTLVLPLYMVYINIGLLTVSSMLYEKKQNSNLFKLSVFLICVVIGIFIMIGMMLGWTYRDAVIIDGVQGRYFCPILPYVFLILNNRKINIKRDIYKYIMFAQIMSFFATQMFVLSYTFVH